MARTQDQAPWLPQDDALLLSCHLITDIRAGRVPPQRAPTIFVLPSGVVAFTYGPCRVFELRAAGDGSYQTSGSFAFGTGTLGLALVAGSMIGNAAANSRARSQAQANAQVVFRHQFDANLYVTNNGFIFHNQTGVHTWTSSDVTAMQVLEPNSVIMQGQSDRGPLNWRINSPYAELIFVLWAIDRHPQHPQLLDGSWLAPGWPDHARRYGHDPRLTNGVLTSAPQQIRLPGQPPPQLEA